MGLRILVVEDDSLLGSLLADMLGGMGHQVDAVVGTEDAAVAAARQYLPDLIVMDQNLKSGCGTSAIARILAERSVPYVMMSGAQVAQAPRAVTLAKPFFEGDLVRAIGRALALNVPA